MQLDAFRASRRRRTTEATNPSAIEEEEKATEAEAEAEAEAREDDVERVGRLEKEMEETRAASTREREALRSELAVTRRSAATAKAELEKVVRELEMVRGEVGERIVVGDGEGERGVAEAEKAKRAEAEKAREEAEKERDEARRLLEEAMNARVDAERRLEGVSAVGASVESANALVDAMRRERDDATRAKETAVVQLRAVELALEESREEQLRCEEELMQLKRDLEEIREERAAHGTAEPAARLLGQAATASNGEDFTVRGHFFTEEDIAAQQEEKYSMLAELQEERRLRRAVESELDELLQTQIEMNARAESASRIAAVAEGEADDYRDRVSKYKTATQTAEREVETLTKRLHAAERVIANVKGEIHDATETGDDDELHTRVRAYLESKVRKLDSALTDAVEETQLLREKTKDLDYSKSTNAADADERVTKLASVRDKLMEEMNAQVLELERLDDEIEKHHADFQIKLEEIAELEAKLAQLNAQNARLIDIIDEQGKWTNTSGDDSARNELPTATASAPVTPVKSLERHVKNQKLARGQTSLLASIEARLLEIQSAA